MGTSKPPEALVEENALLGKLVEALAECLRDLLNAPSDPVVMARARLLLAKIELLKRRKALPH